MIDTEKIKPKIAKEITKKEPAERAL